MKKVQILLWYRVTKKPFPFNSKFFSLPVFLHSTTLKMQNNGILFTAAKIFNLHLVTKCNGNQYYIFVCAHLTEYILI